MKRILQGRLAILLTSVAMTACAVDADVSEPLDDDTYEPAGSAAIEPDDIPAEDQMAVVEDDGYDDGESPSRPTAFAPGAPIPSTPAAQLADARARPLTKYSLTQYGGGGTNSAFFGSAMVVLASAALAGDASADARLLEQLRHNLAGGRDPSGSGGYVAQHELRFAVMVALASKTPRVWSKLSASDKSKIDLLMRGLLVGAAYTSSSKNPEIQRRVGNVKNLVSMPMWWNGNPNFKCAPPAMVLAARVYFGSVASTNAVLDNFDKASFARQLRSSGLTNMWEVFRTDGKAGPMGARPTTAQVQSAIKGWRWAVNGAGVADAEKLHTAILDLTFSKPVSAGFNNGAGLRVGNQMRGRIMSNAGGLPNKGVIGMAHEFDGVDAEGRRSAASYVMWGTRIALDSTVLVLGTNLVNRKSSAEVSSMRRMNIGMVDLRYKSNNGYYSYSHGGTGGGNNENWTASARRTSWGWGYTFGQWFDVIAPAYAR